MSELNDIKKMFSSEFFKYSGVLLSSNVISQIISFTIYPIITRIYTPGVYGDFVWFISIAGILSTLSTGRYELAIVLPKSEKKAVALFQLSSILNVLLFILLFFILFLWKNEIASLFQKENLQFLFLLLPVLVFMTGIWQTINFFFIRQKKYYNISTYNLLQSGIGNGMKCLFGMKCFAQAGLIGGQMLGQFSAILFSLLVGRNSLKAVIKIDKSEIIQAAKTYSNFPKFELPHGLLNVFAGYLPVLLLSMYFGREEIGLFSLALTLGLSPVTLFSNSIYQVLFQKMSERIQNREKIKHECLLFCKICLIVIFPVFFLFIFVPENWFALLFGTQWEGVGFYLKLLLFWLFLVILVASLSFIPDVFFKQKTAMHIEIFYVAIRALSLLTGIYFQNFNLAIIFYCIVSTLMLSVKLIWYFRLIKKYETFL